MTIVAIDLGGTKVATAAFSAAGDILYRESRPLAGRAGADVAALVAERCRAAEARARTLGPSAAAPGPTLVGVAVPGIYHADRGTVWAPNIPGWDDFPLVDALRSALGGSIGADARVVVDSDRAACIVGEAWRGAARGARTAVFLTVGTGIGAGILVDGRVLRGHGDVAGAVGWLALDRPFRQAYVDRGCFEHHASGPGLVTAARELLAHDAGYAGELLDVAPADLTAEHLFAAHDRGDPLAARVLDEAIDFWGMAAANLVSLVNPEVVVFGGGVFGPAARFLDGIRDEAMRWAQPVAMRQARFVASTLGGDAALHGAARLAMLAASAGDAREERGAPRPAAYSLGTSGPPPAPSLPA